MSQTIAPQDTVTKQVGNGAISGPVSIGYYPSEGSKVTSTQYNWSANSHYFEDLQFLKAMGVETAIQSIWIDNSANSYAVTIVIAGSQQRIVVPANSQGVFPAFFSDNASFYISSAGTSTSGLTKVCLLNVPVNTAGVWPVAGSTVLSEGYNGSGIAIPFLFGTQYFSVLANQYNVPQVLIPAFVAQRWFLSSLQIKLADYSTLSGASDVQLNIYDGSNLMFSTSAYVGTSAMTSTSPLVFNLNGATVISTALDQALTVEVSSSVVFTSGGFFCSATGGYTSATP